MGLLATEATLMGSLLESLPVERWTSPTASAGWTVHDVAAHVVGQLEELARPWVTWRRIHRARRIHPGLGTLDGHNQCQVDERRHLRPGALVDLLALHAARAVRVVRAVPGPLRQLRLSLLFPEARSLPDDRIDYLLRILAVRDLWMHRLEIADATGMPLAIDQHDRLIVEQVIADVGTSWTGAALHLTLTGPAGGSWLIGCTTPRATLTVDAVALMRHLSGRRGRILDAQIDGEEAEADRMLSMTVTF
ncbi:maleylpyruvate isomerase family mycothiol-dependent enzyme [Geodermatophilus sp. SYSU D00758]